MKKDTKELRYTKWRTLIEDQKKSGLTQKAFCEQHGLVLSQFFYYRSQIQATEKIDHPSTNLFAPIKLSKNLLNDSCEVRITLPNGFQCVFPCDTDSLIIKKYMEVLLSC